MFRISPVRKLLFPMLYVQYANTPMVCTDAHEKEYGSMCLHCLLVGHNTSKIKNETHDHNYM